MCIVYVCVYIYMFVCIYVNTLKLQRDKQF